MMIEAETIIEQSDDPSPKRVRDTLLRILGYVSAVLFALDGAWVAFGEEAGATENEYSIGMMFLSALGVVCAGAAGLRLVIVLVERVMRRLTTLERLVRELFAIVQTLCGKIDQQPAVIHDVLDEHLRTVLSATIGDHVTQGQLDQAVTAVRGEIGAVLVDRLRALMDPVVVPFQSGRRQP